MAFQFQVIPEANYDDVIHHLRHNFPDEPLNVAVGLCKHGVPCELLEHHVLMSLKDGMSLMALDPSTNDIAGVALNGIARPEDIEESLREIDSIDNLQYQRIFGLLANVNKPLDLFNKYNVEKIFELRILSVDSKYRGKGLAKQLFVKSEMLAQEKGFKLFKVDATSYFTQKIAESLGFITVKSVKYSEFKDENEESIYKTESPHDYYKVVLKVLPSKSDSV